LDMEQIQTHLQGFLGIKAVDRLHVWTIALGQEALFAELTVDIRDGEERDRLLAEMQTSMREKFGIQEVVLQMTAPVTVNLSRPGILLGMVNNEMI